MDKKELKSNLFELITEYMKAVEKATIKAYTPDKKGNATDDTPPAAGGTLNGFAKWLETGELI